VRGSVALILLFLALVLQRGAEPLLALGASRVMPDLPWILLVFIALLAPGQAAAWTALLAGLAVDLLYPHILRTHNQAVAVPIIGPTALGYVAGVYVVLQLRTMFFRESTLTIVMVSFIAGLFVHLVVVGLFALRSMDLFAGELLTPRGFSGELVYRFLSLTYTAVAAAPVGFLLQRTRAWWGFASVDAARRSSWSR